MESRVGDHFEVRLVDSEHPDDHIRNRKQVIALVRDSIPLLLEVAEDTEAACKSVEVHNELRKVVAIDHIQPVRKVEQSVHHIQLVRMAEQSVRHNQPVRMEEQ